MQACNCLALGGSAPEGDAKRPRDKKAPRQKGAKQRFLFCSKRLSTELLFRAPLAHPCCEHTYMEHTPTVRSFTSAHLGRRPFDGSRPYDLDRVVLLHFFPVVKDLLSPVLPRLSQLMFCLFQKFFCPLSLLRLLLLLFLRCFHHLIVQGAMFGRFFFGFGGKVTKKFFCRIRFVHVTQSLLAIFRCFVIVKEEQKTFRRERFSWI